MVEHDRLLEPDARVARALAALFNPHLYPDTQPRIQIFAEETRLSGRRFAPARQPRAAGTRRRKPDQGRLRPGHRA